MNGREELQVHNSRKDFNMNHHNSTSVQSKEINRNQKKRLQPFQTFSEKKRNGPRPGLYHELMKRKDQLLLVVGLSLLIVSCRALDSSKKFYAHRIGSSQLLLFDHNFVLFCFQMTNDSPRHQLLQGQSPMEI
jgi:hypothetical protein